MMGGYRNNKNLPPLARATVNMLAMAEKESLSGITTMKPEITYNGNRTNKNGKKAPDGIEIRFGDARPTEQVRALLKKHGFQFSERQKMWYAYDDASTREFIEQFVSEPVEVDDTQYEKVHFWARVKSPKEYEKLFNRTEFMVKQKYEAETQFYNSKKNLERDSWPEGLIRAGLLSFKKFYNKAIDEESQTEEKPSSIPAAGHIKIAEKLEALADGMEKEVQKKLNPPIGRQRPTARRARIAAGIRDEGYRLLAIQNLLYALAHAHKENTIHNYERLSNIRTKREADLINSYKPGEENQNWMQRQFDNDTATFRKLNINSVFEWSLASQQAKEVSNNYTPGLIASRSETQREIEELERSLIGKKIPGFFPTPKHLIERMLELADIRPGNRILEPSAGKGDILDAISERYPDNLLSAIEPNSSLREILDLKGYNLVGTDFLQHEYIYDKIIMNPPFENGQDVEHVTHALSLIRPGGRVVAVVSEGPFFRQFKKDKAFRELLEALGAYISEPIKEAFTSSFNSTGVNVRIVALDYESNQPIQTALPTATQDEDTLLEAEAEAELEILKVKVELLRKKKEKGLQGIDTGKLRQLEKQAWAMQNDWEVLNFR